MSKCTLRFTYQQKDEYIQSHRNDQLRPIITSFLRKYELQVNKFYFISKEEKILNLDITIDELNAKEEIIQILVSPKEIQEDASTVKESNTLRCAQCIEAAEILFSNNYKIDLVGRKHNTKQIKLNDFSKTQLIDESKIKCSNCTNYLSQTNQNNFYYCLVCKKNLCTTCRSKHAEHVNIVWYKLKDCKCQHHQGQNLYSYCFDCRQNLCLLCINQEQHKKHQVTNYLDILQDIKKIKKLFENIDKIKEIIDDIVNIFNEVKENLDVYIKIGGKLLENLSNKNINYQIIKSLANLLTATFLDDDMDFIIRNNDLDKRVKKIISIYKKMISSEPSNVINIINDEDIISNVQIKKNREHTNEIGLKIKVEQEDVNKNIYFLDNTQNHDKLRELDEVNTTLIIDGQTFPFKKYFNPTKTATYSIKLLLNNKLSNCADMFYNCKNIINIDFSHFKTESITEMSYMFYGCSGLKNLDLSSFNTQSVTNMESMFDGCSRLTRLDLSSFNAQNVTNIKDMFDRCSSLTTLNMSSFNTQNVTNMDFMFCECRSLTSLKLSSFNTQNVTTMQYMFYNCRSLTSLDLSTFNTKKITTMFCMFYKCSALTLLDLSSFKTEKVTNMKYMFESCSSLTSLDLRTFNAANADNYQMFYNCSKLTSHGSSDGKIANAFANKNQ